VIGAEEGWGRDLDKESTWRILECLNNRTRTVRDGLMPGTLYLVISGKGILSARYMVGEFQYREFRYNNEGEVRYDLWSLGTMIEGGLMKYWQLEKKEALGRWTGDMFVLLTDFLGRSVRIKFLEWWVEGKPYPGHPHNLFNRDYKYVRPD